MVTSIRSCFEDSIYEDYSSNILRSQLAGGNEKLVPRGDFFRMRPQGTYHVEELNWAWVGYTLGGRDALEAQQQNKEQNGEE